MNKLKLKRGEVVVEITHNRGARTDSISYLILDTTAPITYLSSEKELMARMDGTLILPSAHTLRTRVEYSDIVRRPCVSPAYEGPMPLITWLPFGLQVLEAGKHIALFSHRLVELPLEVEYEPEEDYVLRELEEAVKQTRTPTFNSLTAMVGKEVLTTAIELIKNKSSVKPKTLAQGTGVPCVKVNWPAGYVLEVKGASTLASLTHVAREDCSHASLVESFLVDLCHANMWESNQPSRSTSPDPQLGSPNDAS